MLVYNHSHSTNPFLQSKKGKWRRRQKKIKGYGTSASAASENFKVPSFQSSGRSRGPRARGPQKCPKIPSFFFFFFPPKIQNYAMSHNSVYGAISLNGSRNYTIYRTRFPFSKMRGKCSNRVCVYFMSLCPPPPTRNTHCHSLRERT